MERHLLDDEGRRLRPPALDAGRAGIVVQGDAADAPEAQTMLWIASILLHRLAGIVGELVICVPEGARATAPWAAGHASLWDALEGSLGRGAGGRPARLVRDMREERLDAAVLLGSGAGACTRAPFETRADCSGWLAYVGDAAGPPPRPPARTRGADGRNPFGAAAAACLAAGEVFKSMRGLDHGASQIAEPLCLSTYDLQTRGAQEGRPANPDLPARIDAGRLAVCGAGAVAHSFCQTLGLTGGLEADLLIVDRLRNYSMGNETIDQSNLARYVMAAGGDLDGQRRRCCARGPAPWACGPSSATTASRPSPAAAGCQARSTLSHASTTTGPGMPSRACSRGRSGAAACTTCARGCRCTT